MSRSTSHGSAAGRAARAAASMVKASLSWLSKSASASPRTSKACRAATADTLTAGTVMERTRTPLSIWFWAAYLVSSHTPGISAVHGINITLQLFVKLQGMPGKIGTSGDVRERE
jgi:hypothetical protein